MIADQQGSEEDSSRIRLPNIKDGEMFGVADQLMGASRIKVMCEDGVSRMGRIPGKIRKRMWIREGDLLIVKVWDFQPDKCDIQFRYTKTQASNLSRRNKIPKNLDIF
ncbi:MAG: translation initiation factor [Candidatus Methanomethylophilaceae archaeon]|nr:translation initiation factor [Candidatus Methanomethylophilaceae archaeon]